MVIIKKFVLSEFGNNCFLIKSNDKYILIDAPRGMKKVISFIQENDITIDYVILTHTHFDHILGLMELENAHLINKVYVSNGEIPLVKDNSQKGNMCDVYNLNMIFKGEVLDVDAIKDQIDVEIEYISGHSKESAVYIFKNDKVIFSGDVIFNGTIGRSDLPYGNQNKLITGIVNKIFALDYEYDVYPGHGFKTRLTLEKENPIYKEYYK